MICPRCSVAEVSPLTGRCVLCGYVPGGGVSVQPSVANEVLETVQRELAGMFELQVLLRTDRRSNLYVARDLADDRLVTLRLVPRPGPVDDELIRRFEQATAVAARLRHPHLVPVFRSGVTTSLLWYSMDAVKGRPLASLLERGPLTRSGCDQLLEQVASGLEYLHRNGVVHGGLSPLTVVVDGDGWARLTDPGIAAALYRAALPGSDWEAVLDAAFAAPEVLERRLVVPAADQYSLALLAYHCLAGRPAWTGETADDVRRERAAGFEPLDALLPDLPPYAVTAVARALREVPSERFPGVLDLVAVLGGGGLRVPGGVWAAGQGAQPVLVPPHEPPPRPRRSPLVVALALVVLALAVALGVLLVSDGPDERWVAAPEFATPVPSTAPPDSAVAPVAPEPARAPPAVEPAAPARRQQATPRVEEPGLLSINSSPWGAVLLDGHPIGNTPRANVPVSPGVHVLRVVRDGFVPFEREIRLTPGQVLRITDIVLEPIRP